MANRVRDLSDAASKPVAAHINFEATAEKLSKNNPQRKQETGGLLF